MPRARSTDPPRPRPGQKRDREQPIDFGRALVEAFLTNERIHQMLLDRLDPRIWNVFPPSSTRRNIATSFAHIHNGRGMRLKMSAPGSRIPARLERATVTMEQARTALGKSAAAMAELIEQGIASGGHVRAWRPDVAALVCASISHETHHRGQICHWARELGAPITPEQQLKLWEWDKRWREVSGAWTVAQLLPARRIRPHFAAIPPTCTGLRPLQRNLEHIQPCRLRRPFRLRAGRS